MALDPLTAVADLAGTVINKIWPDKSAQEKQELAAAVMLPVAKVLLPMAGYVVAVSPADLSEMMPLLFGLLGLGSLRTVEKLNGKARL